MEEAMSVAMALENASDKAIILRFDDNTIQVIEFGEKEVHVFSKNGKSVRRVGRVAGGAGENNIQAAVNQIDKSKVEGVKIRKRQKVDRYRLKETSYAETIKAFEDKVPRLIKENFTDVIQSICGDNLAYRTEMYQQIDHAITMDHNNWFSILPWFTSNVINKPVRGKMYHERKAFVTITCKMGEEEYKIGNTIDKVVENDADFWTGITDKE